MCLSLRRSNGKLAAAAGVCQIVITVTCLASDSSLLLDTSLVHFSLRGLLNLLTLLPACLYELLSSALLLEGRLLDQGHRLECLARLLSVLRANRRIPSILNCLSSML